MTTAGLAVCIPAALYIVTVWALHLRRHHTDRVHVWLFPAGALAVLACAFTPAPVLAAGICLLLLVGAGALTSRVEPT